MQASATAIAQRAPATPRAVRKKALPAVEASQPRESLAVSSGGDDSLVDKLKDFAGRALKGFSRPKDPAYKEGPGPYEAAVDYKSFVDESRHRKIPMVVYYPKDLDKADSSPVVVMSHGLAGNAATYQYFGKHLASQGYTVLQPTHVGSDTTAVLKKTPVFTFTQGELKERVADVKFALDLVEKKDERLPAALTDSADMGHVALAGHSFGALTAVAMAGVAVKGSDSKEIPVADSRIDAFIAMSPYGDSLPSHLLGLDVHTYDRIEKPILYLSGDKDTLFTLGKGATVHDLPFQETGTDETYQVVIGGTRHVEFAQVVGLLDRKTVELTQTTSTAFLDRYLKNDEKAGEYLQNDLPGVARTRESWAFLGPGNHDRRLPAGAEPAKP